ncbi:MAG: hypothetical protein ACKVQA_19220 [Burkholderiales bacterium]
MSAPESYLSATPQCFLAYAPQGAGLLCALVYYVAKQDVHGWWTGSRGYESPTAYFRLESFYSLENTVFTATEGSDIYGGWRYQYSKSQPKLDDPIPVEDDIAHKLDQLQESFAREWLWFVGDETATAEQVQYRQAELATQNANIQYRRLNKLNKDQVIWTYRSHDFDPAVLDYLGPRWPLDYGKELR